MAPHPRHPGIPCLGLSPHAPQFPSLRHEAITKPTKEVLRAILGYRALHQPAFFILKLPLKHTRRQTQQWPHFVAEGKEVSKVISQSVPAEIASQAICRCALAQGCCHSGLKVPLISTLQRKALKTSRGSPAPRPRPPTQTLEQPATRAPSGCAHPSLCPPSLPVSLHSRVSLFNSNLK